MGPGRLVPGKPRGDRGRRDELGGAECCCRDPWI